MISVFEIKMPEYKEYKIDNIEEKCKYKTRFYDLEDIPVTYIENSPDFDVTALRLRDFLRKYYSG
ncbi:MAG: hypothetical protein PHZ09_08460, partial [Eubacteriales bacterium]|nr:hypothetical protein [Eubacteriales bacterium]